MIRSIWRIGCLTVLLIIAFVIYSMMYGGEKFREVGDKTRGVIKKEVTDISNKADRIKEKTDSVTNKVKKWSDAVKDRTLSEDDGDKKDKKNDR
jgi:hypothetical protein